MIRTTDPTVPRTVIERRAAGGSWWQGADVVAVATCQQAGELTAAGRAGAELLSRFGVNLSALAAAERLTGRTGEVFRVPAGGQPSPVTGEAPLPDRLLLIGVGDGQPRELRRAGAALGRAVRGRSCLATTLGSGSGGPGTRAVVEGLVLGGYSPAAPGLTSRSDSAPVATVHLVGEHPPGELERARAGAAATVLARDLAQTPSNIKNPAWMVEQARAVAERSGLSVSVRSAQELADGGFGGLTAVGAGSSSPPFLVRLDHAGTGSRRGRVVLVGKGITYDTGGLSIKPREAMMPMKTDMSGAAAVLAAMAGCAAFGVRRPVTALLPLAENAFGAASYRPGDVVTMFGGRTVEVGNTDAEGRMVLADALAYAVAELDPDILVDVATLTGAATLGLGRRHAAMYATDDRLSGGFERAGTDTGELVWRMPLVEEYRPAIESQIADLRQVPPDGYVGGGSITAALFLREFTAGRRWVHLDIAGPARADRDEHELVKGGTGWGARLLLRWLEGLR